MLRFPFNRGIGPMVLRCRFIHRASAVAVLALAGVVVSGPSQSAQADARRVRSTLTRPSEWIPRERAEVERLLSELGKSNRGFAGMWRIGGRTSRGVPYEGLLHVTKLSSGAYRAVGSTTYPDGNVVSWVGAGEEREGRLHLTYESRTGARGEGDLNLHSHRSATGTWRSLGGTAGSGEEVLARDTALERKHLLRRRADLEEAAAACSAPVALDAKAPPNRPLVSGDGKVRVAMSPLADGTLSREWIRFIDQAKQKLDVAVFEFEIPAIAEALQRARKRGVEIRFLTDSMNLNPVIDGLAKTGIPVVGDGRKAYMHNKFMVADGARVLTGSFNPTHVGESRSDNNLVVVESPSLATQYLAEFEEMFVDRKFGITSPRNTLSAPIRLARRASLPDSVSATTVRVLFAPEDGVKAALLEILQNARKSVDFMSFTINERSIAGTLVEKHLQGLRVRGVIERFKSGDKAGSQFGFLRRAGVPVRLDRSANILHHKVIVIDEESVILTGSYNFSESADRTNDENLLILYNEEIAREFLREFERTWERGEDPGPAGWGAPGVVERLDDTR